jgi:F420H(2)-dependent quinone reductase
LSRTFKKFLERDERDRLYARQTELFPGYAEYQEKTSRVIPVVAFGV